MPASVDRADPWLRLLLVGRKRPSVIDLAVFVDGQPFRAAREAWIDTLLQQAEGNKPPAPLGTKSTAAASQAATAEGKPSAAEEPAAPPGISIQSRRAPTMSERLSSYLAANGGTVDRDEIRWLIAEWGSGPPELLLGPSLSWQRARLAPLLAYWDRDRDGGLSAAEIAAADDLLRRADFDGNDVVDLSEIRRAAKQPAAVPMATNHPLLVQLDAETDWEAVTAMLDHLYGQPRVNSRKLATAPADVTLASTLAPNRSRRRAYP